MTRPRAALVSVVDTPYYHCICRCVRRSWLCGEDVLTGKSFAPLKGAVAIWRHRLSGRVSGEGRRLTGNSQFRRLSRIVQLVILT